jgi:hypothetical protein
MTRLSCWVNLPTGWTSWPRAWLGRGGGGTWPRLYSIPGALRMRWVYRSSRSSPYHSRRRAWRLPWWRWRRAVLASLKPSRHSEELPWTWWVPAVRRRRCTLSRSRLPRTTSFQCKSFLESRKLQEEWSDQWGLLLLQVLCHGTVPDWGVAQWWG